MKWSRFYTLDAQGRLMLPWDALRQIPFNQIRGGELCLADTALGISKPCLLFPIDNSTLGEKEDLPRGISRVAIAGYTPTKHQIIYESNRIRLTKHQIIHLTGKSQVGGMPKRDRTLMIIGIGNFMAITNSNFWY